MIAGAVLRFTPCTLPAMIALRALGLKTMYFIVHRYNKMVGLFSFFIFMGMSYILYNIDVQVQTQNVSRSKEGVRNATRVFGNE